MKRVLIIAALAASSAAAGSAHAASMVATNGKDTVRLYQAPCAPNVLVHIPVDHQAVFQQASATVDGKEWGACWTLRPDGMVLVIYSDGDGGIISASQFRPGEL
jgi:hypothetical protein